MKMVKAVWNELSLREKFALPLLLGFSIWLMVPPKPTPPVISHPLPNVERIEVPKITEKVVKEFISDPGQLIIIKAQAAQINKLKGDVVELTSSLAIARSSGDVGLNGGTIIPVLPIGNLVNETVVNSKDEAGPSSHQVQGYQFKDYQLTALYASDGSRFTYGIQQDFIITTTTGKDRTGRRTTLVDLSQKTPSGLTHIPTITREIFASENPPSWFLSPRIQGGVAFDSTGSKAGLVALQWLRKGTSSAAEDTRFSLMSPALSSRGLTLLPLSVNLGQLKHSPVTNIWLSPSIGIGYTLGFAVTATF